MEQLGSTKKTSFYVIGISYKKADAKLRGDFSLSPTKKARLLNQAKTSGIQSIVATSTCNRTEIYAFVNDPNELVQLLCNNTVGTIEALEPVAYTLKDSLAIEHMFRVGAGLDSQILGDFEIISQLKSSARVSKKYGF